MFVAVSGANAVIALPLGLLAAYLLGSIPTGYMLAKALKGIDIREHGSGNTGATNVFRVIGKGPGIVALGIDLLKGVLAVRLMMALTSLMGSPPALSAAAAGDITHSVVDLTPAIANALAALAALLVVVGHSKSVWLGFDGGKSAATGLGVLLALAWPVGLGVAVVFSSVLAISRTVSVGSIAAALSATIFMLALKQPVPYIALAVAGGFYVVYRHRSNISRLLQGTEPKTFGR